MYALIKNNLVENVINADQAFADSIASEWDAVVQTTTAGIGWSYADGVFTAPVAPEPPAPAPVRRLSKLAYMNRFTDAELGAIYAAAKTVVAVEVWLAKFDATTPEADGTSIDLDDPRTIAGLQGMEAAGLLDAGRAAEILA